MRRTAAVAALALCLVACGSGDATSSQPGSNQGSTVPPSSSIVTDDRATAPEFVLALGDGGTFVLSKEPRPVYLVFWAEW